MRMITTGKAQPQDIGELLALFEAFNLEINAGLSKQQIDDLIRDNYSFFCIAKEGEKIVGMGSQHQTTVTYDGLNHRRITANGIILGNGYVIPSHRRRGIRERLVQETISLARASGVQEVYLSAENEASENLAKKLGFQRVGACKMCHKAYNGECRDKGLYRLIL